MFLERHDELLRRLRPPRLDVAAPAGDARRPRDQKPGWWIAKQLADKLGIGECMPFKDMDEYLRFARREVAA